MGKRYRNLFDEITSMDNLRNAYALTSCGKRCTRGYLDFKEESEPRLAALQEALRADRYEPDPPREFMIYEPKPRAISALGFTDRIVQHALHSVIGPIFDRVLMGRCYACRVGRGTHAGVRAVQAELRAMGAGEGQDVYFLKTDFRSYFANVDRPTLWREIERKISCRRTLSLIEA